MARACSWSKPSMPHLSSFTCNFEGSSCIIIKGRSPKSRVTLMPSCVTHVKDYEVFVVVNNEDHAKFNWSLRSSTTLSLSSTKLKSKVPIHELQVIRLHILHCFSDDAQLGTNDPLCNSATPLCLSSNWIFHLRTSINLCAKSSLINTCLI